VASGAIRFRRASRSGPGSTRSLNFSRSLSTALVNSSSLSSSFITVRDSLEFLLLTSGRSFPPAGFCSARVVKTGLPPSASVVQRRCLTCGRQPGDPGCYTGGLQLSTGPLASGKNPEYGDLVRNRLELLERCVLVYRHVRTRTGCPP